MWRFEAAHDIQIGSVQIRLERILAVQRKVVANYSSADGTERQTIDVLVLRKILPDAPSFAARRDLRIAHRESANFQRGVQVVLLERRRYAQRIGDVVEAK